MVQSLFGVKILAKSSQSELSGFLNEVGTGLSLRPFKVFCEFIVKNSDFLLSNGDLGDNFGSVGNKKGEFHIFTLFVFI